MCSSALRRPVRQRGGDAHVLPEIVRVRIQAEQRDVDRRTRSDPRRGTRARRRECRASSRPSASSTGVSVGGVSVKNNPIVGCTATARCAGNDVQFDDEVAAAFEPPRHASRRDDRTLSGRPSDGVAVGILHIGRHHALEPGLAVDAVEPARRVRAIDAHDGVVDGRGPRTEFHRAHVATRRQREREHELAIAIASCPPSARRGAASWRRDRACRVAIRSVNAGGGGRSAGFPSGARLPPTGGSAQSDRRARRRTPRNSCSPGAGIHGGIFPRQSRWRCRRRVLARRGTHQRERRDLAGPMAGDAIGVEDRRDVFGERGVPVAATAGVASRCDPPQAASHEHEEHGTHGTHRRDLNARGRSCRPARYGRL